MAGANGGSFAHVIERTDVRMIELRDRPRFAVESFAELRIARERRRQDLDRDKAIESRVPRLVDLAHPAGAEGGLDFVRSKPSAGLQRQDAGLYALQCPRDHPRHPRVHRPRLACRAGIEGRVLGRPDRAPRSARGSAYRRRAPAAGARIGPRVAARRRPAPSGETISYGPRRVPAVSGMKKNARRFCHGT